MKRKVQSEFRVVIEVKPRQSFFGGEATEREQESIRDEAMALARRVFGDGRYHVYSRAEIEWKCSFCEDISPVKRDECCDEAVAEMDSAEVA